MSSPAGRSRNFAAVAAVAVVFMLGLLASTAAWGQNGGKYSPPPTPVLLPADSPGLVPLDAEVDAFTRVPDARAQFHVTGKGLAVVVIDTGVNAQHISLQGQLLPGRNFSTEGDADDTTDRNGHGSNVAGIIAARAVAAEEEMPVGIAIEAKIIPIKVFPGGTFFTINQALQWVLDHLDDYKTQHRVTISVVNMSLGTDENLEDVADVKNPLLIEQRALIAALRAKNVAVTVAAGNSYYGFHSKQGMGFPAICPETVSVGAVFDVDVAPNPDGAPLVIYGDLSTVFRCQAGRCTPFSQRLGAGADGKSPYRTDIFAPGYLVTSLGPALPPESKQDSTRTRTTQNGTSQASPVTAGILLLLQNHYRNLHAKDGLDPGLPSVNQLEEWIRKGGVAFRDVEDEFAKAMDNVVSCGAGFFRLDAVRALTAVDLGFKPDLRKPQKRLFRADPRAMPSAPGKGLPGAPP